MPTREGRALPYTDRWKRLGRGALRAPVFAPRSRHYDTRMPTREGGALPYKVTAPLPARNETQGC